jgi:hypothetical protein
VSQAARVMLVVNVSKFESCKYLPCKLIAF